jgi:hypothetical protein
MSNVIPFIKRSCGCGECPICHGSDNVWNVGRDHWAVCHKHKTKWFVGSNLFGNWRRETEQDWLVNKYRLANYRTVEPYIPEERKA